MAGKERNMKDSAMAAHLVKVGIWHGKRLTAPHANSGGLTGVNEAGSSKNQRMVKAREYQENQSNERRARRQER